MQRVPALTREETDPSCDALFDVIEKSNGYIPLSYLTMAHVPRILEPFAALSKAVIRDEGATDRKLRFLVAYVASRTTGCQYCQAHNIASASKLGVEDEKLDAIWNYEESPLFTEAERAALDLAYSAAQVPNDVTDATIERMKAHYTTEQIIELVSVVSLFGWMNRFNSSLAIEFDDHTLKWADEYGLTEKTGWDPSKHMPE